MATLTVCLLTAVAERASCSFDVASLINSLKSGHEFQKKITCKGFKLVFFDIKFQFLVEFINLIGNFISSI